jgi:AcrR family transcriptional regulator
MEAATSTRRLDGEKAQRIVAAMRTSVGRRGAAASTFDHVARDAGVSRGLLHYYFGSKERLLVEVLRHDAAIRMRALEERLERADSVDAIIDALVTQLEQALHEDADAQTFIYEMFSVSRRNEDVRAELAKLYRDIRAHVGELLRSKEREGVVRLGGDPNAVAAVIFALGDGILLQRLCDPGWDSSEAIATGVRAARFLLGAE